MMFFSPIFLNPTSTQPRQTQLKYHPARDKNFLHLDNNMQSRYQMNTHGCQPDSMRSGIPMPID